MREVATNNDFNGFPFCYYDVVISLLVYTVCLSAFCMCVVVSAFGPTVFAFVRSFARSCARMRVCVCFVFLWA